MGKKIILTESQFKDYMRRMMCVDIQPQQQPKERELEIEEVDALLHRMIIDDFFVYFPKYGKRYNCAYLHEKGEIFEAVCTTPMPKLTSDGWIMVRNEKYGEFGIENLINAQV